MSVVRINQFQALKDRGHVLEELLEKFVPLIKAAEGCESCQLLRSNDNPDRHVILEVWESIDAHKASIRNISPEQIEALMKIVAGPPKGGYYNFL